jgi:hypothetical protein
MDYYLALSKNAKGKALDEIITEVTMQPFINYHPLLQQLRESNRNHKLLDFFQYKQYKDLNDQFQLNKEQKRQLLLLTLLDLLKDKHFHYDHLQKELKLKTVLELEDLIITLVERGWANAKLDQKNKVVKVSGLQCRFYNLADELVDIERELSQWKENLDQAIEKIDHEIARREETFNLKNQQQLEFEKELEKLKKQKQQRVKKQ